MTHSELLSFIKSKMSMQHVYQPLLIKTLVECGGSATVRQLAQAVLGRDEPQIRYYEDRIKKMPVPVLKGHGVVEKQGDTVSLATEQLSPEQESELITLCEQKLQEFLLERFLHRFKEFSEWHSTNSSIMMVADNHSQASHRAVDQPDRSRSARVNMSSGNTRETVQTHSTAMYQKCQQCRRDTSCR